MAVTYNIKGTTNSSFKVGKQGTGTVYAGSIEANNLTATGNLNITGNLTVSGTTTTIDATTIDVKNAFRFEGATSDAHETVLTVADPTADRTITLPDTTGTVALTSDISGGTQAGSFTTLTSSGLVTFNGQIGSNFVPSANATYDLGSESNQWNDLFLSNASIIMGDSKISMDSSGDMEVKHKSTGALRKLIVDEIHLGSGSNKVKLKRKGSGNKLRITDASDNVSDNEMVDDTSPQLGGSLDVNGNSIVSTSNGNITFAPHGTGAVTISGTGAITVPVGTTAQRPGSAVTGMFRFNSTTKRFEGYNGIDWVAMSPYPNDITTSRDGDPVQIQPTDRRKIT